MSGIAGVIRLDGAPVSPSEIDAMLVRLLARGPDRQQSWATENVGLGQTLLATTLEALAEVQPWTHGESGCAVVTDSRLDNRRELLEELGFGGLADEIGDGALLHAAWQRWGRDCAKHLLGDFAFAIWDSRNQRLFCARDHMGIRPLYYHHSPGQLFAFASEPRALLALPRVPKGLNEGRIADVLTDEMEGFDKTSSMFQAISRLPPAHTLELDETSCRLQEYWTIVDRPPPAGVVSEQEWIDGLEALVVEAVRCRMRGHGRIGSMLSGGLDSSAVVAIASEYLSQTDGGPLPTFSAVSSTPACPETRAVNAILNHLPLDATLIDPAQIPDTLDQIAATIGSVGEQFDASMTIIDCQYLAAHEQNVRIVLDGLDPDSLFAAGDYLSRWVAQGRLLHAWRESRQSARFYNQPYSLREWLLPSLMRGLVPPRIRAWIRKWRTIPLPAESMLSTSAEKRIGMAGRRREHAALIAADHVRHSPPGAMTSSDSPYLLAGIERYGRIASRRGIEPRHPFLDRRLVEYCAWLPSPLRVRDGYPKWALRRAMSTRLPSEVAWRRGKEHLGWQFNLAVLNRLPKPASPLFPVGHTLERFVNIDRIPVAPSADSWGASDTGWEHAYRLQSLQAWLDELGVV